MKADPLRPFADAQPSRSRSESGTLRRDGHRQSESRARFAICGMGTALPPFAVDQHAAAAFATMLVPEGSGSARLLEALYRRSGVERRYSVVLETDRASTPVTDLPSTAGDIAAALQARQQLFAAAHDASDLGPTTAQRMAFYRAHAGTLAAQAARTALERADIPAAQITQLVTVSCTGFTAPGIDLELIDELGLPRTTQRTHVGFMGCHGAINGLRVAEAFAAADPSATVLLCAVELCSLHQQYGWYPDRIVANALFADGAAAVVGRQPSAHDRSSWRLVATGSCVLEQARHLMTWEIGNHGFVMGLSPEVPAVIRRYLRDWLAGWLRSFGLGIEDIGSWAIHPGGPRIVQSAVEALGLAPSAAQDSLEVLKNFGNMSSPTVLFILERLARRGAPRPTVMLAFGPGLAMEAALWM